MLMVFVSATRLRLRGLRYLPFFFWHTGLSLRQAVKTPGFLGGELLRDANQTFWTLTLWDEQAAMKFYRNSGSHRQAMPKLQDWCNEAAVVHWSQSDSQLPTWAEVHRRMVAEGHFTRLKHPASAHLERHIAGPTASRGVRFFPRSQDQPVPTAISGK
jgi:heme-degrading monooxygenase HmoA